VWASFYFALAALLLAAQHLFLRLLLIGLMARDSR
jgi:hypothetical protein